MFAWFAVSYDLTVWAHYINHPYKQIHIVIFSCSSHINFSYIHDNTDHNKWRGWPKSKWSRVFNFHGYCNILKVTQFQS